ncbi:aminodeoxychorismate synthase component I [Pontibacter sp. JAM-7]|uniref:aminodeoxychorismate synthase component I n=1 Tax=Pontibacter sp. JAM-7 TaxID=3366581 RepID=UPI003AF57D84
MYPIQQRSLPYKINSLTLFERIRSMGHGVFLDSGRPACPWGRFDILAAAPVELLTCSVENPDNPFPAVDQLYRKYALDLPQPEHLPFCGGLMGHFNYDLGRRLEALPNRASQSHSLPDLQLGLYLWAVVVDHQRQQTTLVAAPSVPSSQLDDIEQQLLTEASGKTAPFRLQRRFSANINETEYHQKLSQIDRYIHAGDCYQVNFAQRFDSEYRGDPWHAYRQLREVAPTPYAAFIDTAEGAILSLSPEQFLEVRQGQVKTRPIKGTRPRAADAVADQALKAELQASTKDRAENLMIVDLLRNDLSRVCQHNSVKVPELFKVESYANVHHLVSTITGQLPENASPVDLLEHCFPGGSITGAPKIRAMEIIEELEPHRRSIYCGSIGYISLCGRMDTSITIRTVLCEQQKVYCWAGGGIVADSITEMEYQETFNKVNNLLNALNSTQK